ncbi:MAG TPA: hypothetical protein VHT00_18225 [Stellaceae bacterium]|jgi:enoyl-CoA hydratase/carnithine racemase|nr:hypothetical protein [Stellaceae bacterium]
MALHLTRVGELALITLDRPEVLNALNFELLRDFGPRSTRWRAAMPGRCW